MAISDEEVDLGVAVMKTKIAYDEALIAYLEVCVREEPKNLNLQKQLLEVLIDLRRDKQVDRVTDLMANMIKSRNN